MKMILHGIEAPNILHTNTLTENLADIQEKDRFDVVLANPPPAGRWQNFRNGLGALPIYRLTGSARGKHCRVYSP